MDYIELDFQLQPLNDDRRDLLIYYLGEAGFESFLETEQGFLAYIPSPNFDPETVRNMGMPGLEEVEIHFSTKTIPTRNWNEAWEQNYPPVSLGNRVHIRAPFHPPPSNFEFDLVILPKMSFGTGHHETTSLMILEMLQTDFQGKRVLDMGCGTGILAILASKLGAASVIAIDNDDWAVQNAIENVERNLDKPIPVLKGDATSLANQTFDLILANINLNILLADMQAYVSTLSPQGSLILSGILTSDLPQITGAALSCGLRYDHHANNHPWICVSFHR